MIILGINAYHGDSSACLLVNGVLTMAVEEERFNRVKHWAGFPAKSISHCLSSAGITLGDVDYVAINQSPSANLFRKIFYTVTNMPDAGLILDRIKNRRKRSAVIADLNNCISGQRFYGKVFHVEHHLAHLVSAHLVSPFEKSISVSVDGFGDFASAAWGVAHGNDINVDGRVCFPHSLGIFYMALTQYLGFPKFGDEYKVMGLSSYGKPKYLAKLENLINLQSDGSFKLNLKYFNHHKQHSEVEWNSAEPKVRNLFSLELEDLLGPKRKPEDELLELHKDIASTAQTVYEQALFHLLNSVHSKYGLDNLSFSGGCAMNSVANGKIFKNTPFTNLYIPPAAGDAGGAVGAAFDVWRRYGDGSRQEMTHAYWGVAATKLEIQSLLGMHKAFMKKNNIKVNYFRNEDKLISTVANAIKEGKVVGWFQGRMEFGPRALGNRSILGDPRRANMKDILNIKIKRRESFRPFAPSVLRGSVEEWFEQDDEVPFMMQVYKIKKSKRSKIPAVTHVDGTGRLQTVNGSDNPRYFKLISEFEKRTGVPMILNTSFNENEPIVCTPEEALNCFLRTQMDVLVLGDYYIQR
ncbi:carbamoyltransferase [Alphaproteobacteria bacterium]|nr:carbamoyltransferase [Alphaproteobacteria bacterium]